MRAISLGALALILVLFLSGCEKQADKPVFTPPAPQTQAAPAVRSLIPTLVELPTAALPFWREHRQEKPALVLMSFDPFLQPIPAELRERARDLALSGTPQEIDRHGSYPRIDPVIVPTQALSAALAADFFSKIYWVFPSKVAPLQLEIDKFREQMVKAEFLTQAEAREVEFRDGRYAGTLRGVPFEALHFQKLAEITGPVVVHLDLSYFRGLYDNEIKTPLYDLIHQSASTLLTTSWQPLALTLSYSTVQGAISLDTRFVLTNLAEILREPRLLTEAMPRPWELRAEALYAADMFTESKKIELYREAVQLAPDDATTIYDLFQAHFLAKNVDQALQALDRAVALDPGYGAAYLRLADMALQDQNPEAALTLLEKASAVFPENPFIDLQRADLLRQMGAGDQAQALMEPLKDVSWSPVYHAEIPGMIDQMLAPLSDQKSAAQSAAEKGND